MASYFTVFTESKYLVLSWTILIFIQFILNFFILYESFKLILCMILYDFCLFILGLVLTIQDFKDYDDSWSKKVS